MLSLTAVRLLMEELTFAIQDLPLVDKKPPAASASGHKHLYVVRHGERLDEAKGLYEGKISRFS